MAVLKPLFIIKESNSNLYTSDGSKMTFQESIKFANQVFSIIHNSVWYKTKEIDTGVNYYYTSDTFSWVTEVYVAFKDYSNSDIVTASEAKSIDEKMKAIAKYASKTQALMNYAISSGKSMTPFAGIDIDKTIDELNEKRLNKKKGPGSK